jgi:hypothetical protein
VSHCDTLTRCCHWKSQNLMDPLKTAEGTGGAPTCLTCLCFFFWITSRSTLLWPLTCEILRLTWTQASRCGTPLLALLQKNLTHFIISCRRRDKDFVKTHGPRIKVVPKNLKNYGLSNETSLERFDRDLFVSRFYTKIVQKTEKYRFSNSSKN